MDSISVSPTLAPVLKSAPDVLQATHPTSNGDQKFTRSGYLISDYCEVDLRETGNGRGGGGGGGRGGGGRGGGGGGKEKPNHGHLYHVLQRDLPTSPRSQSNINPDTLYTEVRTFDKPRQNNMRKPDILPNPLRKLSNANTGKPPVSVNGFAGVEWDGVLTGAGKVQHCGEEPPHPIPPDNGYEAFPPPRPPREYITPPGPPDIDREDIPYPIPPHEDIPNPGPPDIDREDILHPVPSDQSDEAIVPPVPPQNF